MNNQINPPTKSPKARLISLAANVAILVNLGIGFFGVHWLIIALFIAIHAFLRMAYLKADSEAQVIDPNQTQTTIAPPLVRNIASVITAVLLAVVLYWLGFGLAKLVS